MLLFVFLTGHFVIASATTGHALLNKKDVRSAIGWIGLAWLSPVLGSGLYYAFGINRVARRAVKHSERGERLLERPCKRNRHPASQLKSPFNVLAGVGEELSGESLLHGNRIDILIDGDAAYPAMIAQIDAAKQSVCLGTYIFRSDEVGEQFADALISAHQRGVEVRVLVDAIGSGFFVSRVVRRLKAEGLSVARFMFDRHPWSMAFINLRNHKKLLLIDGKKGYVGGLNLGSENTVHFVARQRVNDIQFCLSGPVVAQLMRNFVRDWQFATGEILDAAIWWPDNANQGNSACRVLSSGPDEDVGKIEMLFSAALNAARQHVRIVTPYFLPDETLSDSLRLAALRGVKVEVILPEKSDHIIIDWAVRGHLWFLKDHGLNCYFSTTHFDHTKLMTVDGEWCAFGSPNWDVRSLRLNFELLVECYSRKTVGVIDRLIDDKLKKSKPLDAAGLRRQSLPIRLRNATARLLLPYL